MTATRSSLIPIPGPICEDTRAMLNAVYAPLMGRPVSDQGRAVVCRLHSLIEQYELSHSIKPRKYKRGKTNVQFDKAIGAFAADLLLAQRHAKAKGWVYRSLRDESYDGGPVTRTQGKAVVKGLSALKLMRHVEGYTRYGAFGRERYVAPKLCATRELLQICEECGVGAGSFEKHFTRGPPKDLVVVRGRATYSEDRKFKGKVLKVDVPTQLRDEVQELNAFLEGHTLEHGTHRGFFRGYNNGDVEGFAFKRGGRLYSVGEDSYQSLTDRLSMKIDGEPVAEVDVRASYLTILYAIHQHNFEGDPYVIPPLGLSARDAVKMFIAATIGNGAPRKKWPRKQAKIFLEKTGLSLQKRWPIATIARWTLECHPILKALKQPINGRIVDWSELMWVESQAIVKTMLDLKRNYKIASYPVHDSLIVPKSKATRAKRQFEAHYYGELREFYSKPSPPRLRILPEAAPAGNAHEHHMTTLETPRVSKR